MFRKIQLRQWTVPAAIVLLAFATDAMAGSAQSVQSTNGAQAQTPQCDSASFAAGSSANRAACRRMFARELRPSVQNSPQTAADYGQ